MMARSRHRCRPAPKRPARRGDVTHVRATVPSRFQARHPGLVPTDAIPTTAPMTACVVLTGMPVVLDSSRKTAVASRAAHMPNMNSDILELQKPQAQQSGPLMSETLWIVSDTPVPGRT